STPYLLRLLLSTTRETLTTASPDRANRFRISVGRVERDTRSLCVRLVRAVRSPALLQFVPHAATIRRFAHLPDDDSEVSQFEIDDSLCQRQSRAPALRCEIDRSGI